MAGLSISGQMDEQRSDPRPHKAMCSLMHGLGPLIAPVEATAKGINERTPTQEDYSLGR